MNELIKARINARWHGGAKSFHHFTPPTLQCTADVYGWLNTLTNGELLDVLECQTNLNKP